MQDRMHNRLAKELRTRLDKLEETSGYPVFGEVFLTDRYGGRLAILVGAGGSALMNGVLGLVTWLLVTKGTGFDPERWTADERYVASRLKEYVRAASGARPRQTS